MEVIALRSIGTSLCSRPYKKGLGLHMSPYVQQVNNYSFHNDGMVYYANLMDIPHCPEIFLWMINCLEMDQGHKEATIVNLDNITGLQSSILLDVI